MHEAIDIKNYMTEARVVASVRRCSARRWASF